MLVVTEPMSFLWILTPEQLLFGAAQTASGTPFAKWELCPVHTIFWNLNITLAWTPWILGIYLCIHALYVIIFGVYSTVLICIRNVIKCHHAPILSPPINYIFCGNITLSFEIENTRISFLINNCIF